MARPGRPAELARIARGLLIGAAPGTRWEVTTVPIPAGTLSCFLTDGLVERLGHLIDDRLDRLRHAVAPEPPEAACTSVLSSALPVPGLSRRPVRG